jgi:hypothetical protein
MWHSSSHDSPVKRQPCHLPCLTLPRKPPVKPFLSLLALSTLTLAQLANAGAKCPDVPESQWMPILDMQKKIVNEYGFAIKKFQTDGHCYEIYGWGKSEDGKSYERIEVYFNPVTGEIVKKKVEK